jgi:O-antigen/teichoic acid export membrane protein
MESANERTSSEQDARATQVAEVADRASSGAFLLTARGAGLRVISFAGNAVLARLLLPRDFGLLAFGFALISLGSFLVDSGFGAALLGSNRDPDRQQLGAVLGFQLAVTALVVAVMFVLALPFGQVMALSALMCSGMLFFAVRAPASIVLERNLTYAPLAAADVIDTMSYTVLAIGLVLAGQGVWGVAFAFTVRGALGTVFLVSRTKAARVRPNLSLTRLRPILSFGVQYQAISLVGLIRDEVMNVAVGAVAGFAVLGIVALADRLMTTVMLLFESLWRVSYPAMAQLRRLGHDAGPIVDRVSRLCLLATAFLVVGLSAGLPGSLTVVFGSKWYGALYILPGALAGLLVVGPVSTACAGYLFAAGDARSVLWSASLHTLVAWVSLPLYFLFGLTGFAIQAVVVCIAEAVMLARATARHLGRNPLQRLLGPGAVALAISAAAWEIALSVPRGLLNSLVIAAVAELTLAVAFYVVERETLVDFIALTRRHLTRFRPMRGRAPYGAAT